MLRSDVPSCCRLCCRDCCGAAGVRFDGGSLLPGDAACPPWAKPGASGCADCFYRGSGPRQAECLVDEGGSTEWELRGGAAWDQGLARQQPAICSYVSERGVRCAAAG